MDSCAYKKFSYKSAHLSKVPGEVIPIGKFPYEVKSFRDLKDVAQLKEMLIRLNSIKKSKLMTKLPDEGQKIYNEIKRKEVK